jgi:hypothetical protein
MATYIKAASKKRVLPSRDFNFFDPDLEVILKKKLFKSSKARFLHASFLSPKITMAWSLFGADEIPVAVG